ncbi:MAG: hypothetical protein CSB48_01660 [Proteobacteria bacterium]|nr:MAG: hypothetical protein CSB48_01660 [Pseudomonadota bacterium]PIE40238.1 MAG: hypothetical protein CSA51_01795 [Gammaproteobacteria bacterium]
MTRQELTHLLQSEIPLCAFMQLAVAESSDNAIVTNAPLSPNRNVHQTGFAGSLYALAVATGWALVYNKMQAEKAEGSLVVKTAKIHYKRPVKSDIRLTAELNEQQKEQGLTERLKQNGRAECTLKVWIESENRRCGYLEANYIIIA